MALTLRHWIAIAALGCAAVAVAYLPPDPGSSDPRFPAEGQRRTALTSIETALRRANQLSVILRERDEALALLHRAPRSARSPVFVDAGRARRFERYIVDAAATLAPLDSAITLAVSLVPNQAVTREGQSLFFNRLWYAFPEGTDGRTCLVIVPEGTLARLGEQNAASSLLGPCAFYAAFGQPGPGIEAWLAAVNYYPAQEADWVSARPRSPDPTADDLSKLTLPQLLESGLMFAARQGMSLPAAGCAAGRRERCNAALGVTPWYRRFLDEAHTADKPGWLGGTSDQSWYLADLVREMGRDRFGRFWRSPLPRDSAFVEVYDMPIEEWTHRWLAERHPDVLVGPAIRVTSALLGLVASAMLVAGGAYYAARRQIG